MRPGSLNGSPCAACGVRTIGRISGTRSGPECSACSSWSGSSDACIPRKPSSLRCADLSPQVAAFRPGASDVQGTTRPPPSRASGRGAQTVWRPALRRRAEGDWAATASARAAARSRPAAARWRSIPVSMGSGATPRVSARRRYSVTSGGRARALGDPAERTRWQRVCSGVDRRLGRPHPHDDPTVRQQHLAVVGVDRQQEATAAEAELELLLQVEDLVAVRAGVAPHAQRRVGVRRHGLHAVGEAGTGAGVSTGSWRRRTGTRLYGSAASTPA